MVATHCYSNSLVANNEIGMVSGEDCYGGAKSQNEVEM